MVTLTSITTKVSDASRTIIYRTNSPKIYACVNKLEFYCIYCQPISDASRTIIYRANSPTIYACVNELEFHCIYCQPILLVEFPLYISTMQSMQAKCLRTKPKHEAQFPSNPRNFSPIGIHCQNGRKCLEV
jgi:hypothetical protein